MSLFFKEIKANKKLSLNCLTGFECNKIHTLKTLLGTNYDITATPARKKLEIIVNLREHPHWKKQNHLEGYELGVIVLYPDFTKQTCRKEVAAAPIVHFTSPLAPVHFDLPMPSAKAHYILLLRISASIRNDEVLTQPNLNGLAW